jgi:para-aminobenzoate synthetase
MSCAFFCVWSRKVLMNLRSLPSTIPTLTLEGASSLIHQAAGGRQGCLVVAIDGRSGSGKSTLARKLSSLVGESTVLEGDDFFCGGTVVRSDPPSVLVSSCIDWREQARVLSLLRQGLSASYHAFDWDRFDGSVSSDESLLTPKRVLFLEGTYSARPELANLVDLRFVVVVDDEVRLRRLVSRDGGIGLWEKQWIDAEPYYFDVHLPKTHVDGLLSGV